MTRQQPLYFILSFFLVAFAQPDWSPLACVAASAFGYALFWKGMLLSKGRRIRFVEATLWFGAIHAVQISWFSADRYVGGYIYLLLPILSIAIGAQFGLVSLFVGRLSTYRILGISGGWALFEWARLYFLSGYSWNPTGLALSGTLYGMQIASAIGVFGMGFWVVMTNLFALKVMDSFSRRDFAIWIPILITPYLFGWVHVVFHEGQMEKRPDNLWALAVQTSIYPEYKISFNGSSPLSPQAQWERILSMLSPFADSSPDLILFPEATLPYGVDYPIYPVEVVKQTLSSFFEEFEPPLTAAPYVGNGYWAQSLADLFSASVIIGLEAVERERAYNAAFLFNPLTKESCRYEKRVLVPFGEYIPFDWSRPFLAKYGIFDSFTPGNEAKIFRTKRALVGLSICYEETYGHLMRESRLKGAELLVNLSNDVWYPRSRLPMVHFLHGRLRALEGGIPLLRSCNTGVTCGVDSLGRAIGMLPYESARNYSPATTLALSIPLYNYPTFYTQFGDLPLILFSAFSFCCLCISSLFKRKSFALNDLKVSPLQKN